MKPTLLPFMMSDSTFSKRDASVFVKILQSTPKRLTGLKLYGSVPF